MNYVCEACWTPIDLESEERCSRCDGTKFTLPVAHQKTTKRVRHGKTVPEKEPLYGPNYRVFELSLEQRSGIFATVYIGEGESFTVEMAVSDDDKDFFASLKKILVKAYRNEENRVGPRAMSQDNPILMKYGAGPVSTVSLFNLVAQRILGGGTLVHHRGQGAYPINGNWLDLRRENVAVAETDDYYG
jgi:hypothetical protein